MVPPLRATLVAFWGPPCSGCHAVTPPTHAPICNGHGVWGRLTASLAPEMGPDWPKQSEATRLYKSLAYRRAGTQVSAGRGRALASLAVNKGACSRASCWQPSCDDEGSQPETQGCPQSGDRIQTTAEKWICSLDCMMSKAFLIPGLF